MSEVLNWSMKSVVFLYSDINVSHSDISKKEKRVFLKRKAPLISALVMKISGGI